MVEEAFQGWDLFALLVVVALLSSRPMACGAICGLAGMFVTISPFFLPVFALYFALSFEDRLIVVVPLGTGYIPLVVDFVICQLSIDS